MKSGQVKSRVPLFVNVSSFEFKKKTYLKYEASVTGSYFMKMYMSVSLNYETKFAKNDSKGMSITCKSTHRCQLFASGADLHSVAALP